MLEQAVSRLQSLFEILSLLLLGFCLLVFFVFAFDRLTELRVSNTNVVWVPHHIADAVKGIVVKEELVRESKGNAKVSKQSLVEHDRGQPQGPQRNDAFADDHMLEDAFGMDGAQRQATIRNEIREDDAHN